MLVVLLAHDKDYIQEEQQCTENTMLKTTTRNLERYLGDMKFYLEDCHFMRAPLLDARVKIKRWANAETAWNTYLLRTKGKGRQTARAILAHAPRKHHLQQQKLDVFIAKKYDERIKITKQLLDNNMYKPVLEYFVAAELLSPTTTKLTKDHIYEFLKLQKPTCSYVRLSGTKADLFKQTVQILTTQKKLIANNINTELQM